VNYIPQRSSFVVRPDEEVSSASPFFKDWGIKVGVRRLY
jgi:hypothetical protein